MLFTQEERPLDIIPVGRIAIDFNPTDMNRPLSQSEHFNKYLGGSPANIAVGMAAWDARWAFWPGSAMMPLATLLRDFSAMKALMSAM